MSVIRPDHTWSTYSTHGIIGYISFVLLGVYALLNIARLWWQSVTAPSTTQHNKIGFWALFLCGISAWLLAITSLIMGIQLMNGDGAYFVFIGAYLQIALIILIRRVMLQWSTPDDLNIANEAPPPSTDTEKTLVN
ncbi:hypothetical protein BDF19DRAFT_463642 [Syncephalis fuscata]|nr:hypothetical protein BDF19DRAFT_463642 [Syncephalis fuscata]